QGLEMKKEATPIKSNLERLDAMNDADIDYSDIPALDDSFFTARSVELELEIAKLKTAKR
ncbi:MAG: hypothetical protein K5Q00_02750, partial [Gammaproteobacteria bacterium]|nr:hypothetical protein [Gammaproteobacteria bacterium]